jgi:hypothetical protein
MKTPPPQQQIEGRQMEPEEVLIFMIAQLRECQAMMQQQERLMQEQELRMAVVEQQTRALSAEATRDFQGLCAKAVVHHAMVVKQLHKRAADAQA